MLAEVPFKHQGKGLVSKAELSGAGVYLGAFNGDMQLAPSTVKQVQGGTDSYFLPAAWLVCDYGGGISWWEQLQLDPHSATSCILQSRKKVGRSPMDISLICR